MYVSPMKAVFVATFFSPVVASNDPRLAASEQAERQSCDLRMARARANDASVQDIVLRVLDTIGATFKNGPLLAASVYIRLIDSLLRCHSTSTAAERDLYAAGLLGLPAWRRSRGGFGLDATMVGVVADAVLAEMLLNFLADASTFDGAAPGLVRQLVVAACKVRHPVSLIANLAEEDLSRCDPVAVANKLAAIAESDGRNLRDLAAELEADACMYGDLNDRSVAAGVRVPKVSPTVGSNEMTPESVAQCQRAVEYIREHPDCVQRQLADHLGLKPSTVRKHLVPILKKRFGVATRFGQNGGLRLPDE
jgi:hypothetical protein